MAITREQVLHVAKLAHLLVEDNHRILRIKTLITLLRIREVKPLKHLNRRVLCSEQSFGLERIAHTRVDPVDFRPRL